MPFLKMSALTLLGLGAVVFAAGPSLSRRQEGAAPASSNISVVYRCDNGDTIAATYPRFPSTGSASLSIHSREIVLQPAMSADGGRYLANSGQTEGKVLEWWIKGSGATLSEGPVGQGDDGSKTLLATCRVVDGHR